MRGLLVKSTGSSYTVYTDDGCLHDCRIKGNFRIKGIKSTNPVAVGDIVDFIPSDNPSNPSFITAIGDRRNYIIRRSSNLSKQSHILACNIDLCVLVVTISHPETSPVFIDRFLASAQAYRIPVLIYINKTDLLEGDDIRLAQEFEKLYTSIGYQVLSGTAIDGTASSQLREHMKGKMTLLAGNSGVGKSTLINSLIPGIDVRTGRISDKHDTGMHTTTFSEMYRMPDGGWITDTPGIKGFGLYDMQPDEISHYFTEIFQYSADCRYSNCTHTNEPGCAVKNAVEKGEISVSRYNSYLSMLTDDDNDGKYRKME